ncbi:MAG: NADH-quinone oxidoreductase subunit M [Bdellovibrionota bacterium]|nr:NADH-quinone oxidoreductase subunit M [Bdellovibrionota bacterium]
MLLSLILFVPVIGAALVALMPNEKLVRPLALFASLVELGLALFLLQNFDTTTAAMQFVEKKQWIASFGINYFLGIDGISLWLVILTCFLTPIIIVGSWSSISERTKSFHVSLLVLQTAMLGTFLSLDMVLFYTFWELSLVPMYFMIGIWGGARRIYATVKFFIFTMFGSVFMLVAMISLLYLTKQQLGFYSASILDFYRLEIPYIRGAWLSPQTLMFIAFSLAFAIKVPMFPVHTWLPDAHTEAPTPGSVILAGVMLKMGTYGFMRFSIPLFPDAVEEWSWFFLFIGVVGMIYGSLVAMVQTDIKKLVAYSSVAHMGYVVLGLFALNSYGFSGALYQMLNHGISTGALFLLVGMIYDRTHSREIAKYGGLAKAMPLYTICFFIITLSSIAVPGTNGFIGEFLILMGTFISAPIFGILAVTGVVLGAAYMLWMFKRVFFGQEGELILKFKEQGGLKDLNLRELGLMVVMIVMVFWMGIFPKHFLDYSKESLDHLTENYGQYELSMKTEIKEQMTAQVER